MLLSHLVSAPEVQFVLLINCWASSWTTSWTTSSSSWPRERRWLENEAICPYSTSSFQALTRANIVFCMPRSQLYVHARTVTPPWRRLLACDMAFLNQNRWQQKVAMWSHVIPVRGCPDWSQPSPTSSFFLLFLFFFPPVVRLYHDLYRLTKCTDIDVP